ncbi:MAG: hypothetical protein ACTHK7_02880, partial [Aureliella sp.]
MSQRHPLPWTPFEREIITERRQLWKKWRVDLRHWTRALYEAETREQRNRILTEQLAVIRAVYCPDPLPIEQAREWAAEV